MEQGARHGEKGNYHGLYQRRVAKQCDESGERRAYRPPERGERDSVPKLDRSVKDTCSRPNASREEISCRAYCDLHLFPFLCTLGINYFDKPDEQRRTCSSDATAKNSLM